MLLFEHHLGPTAVQFGKMSCDNQAWEQLLAGLGGGLDSREYEEDNNFNFEFDQLFDYNQSTDNFVELPVVGSKPHILPPEYKSLLAAASPQFATSTSPQRHSGASEVDPPNDLDTRIKRLEHE